MKQKKVMLMTSLVSLGTDVSMAHTGKPDVLGQRAAERTNSTDFTIF